MFPTKVSSLIMSILSDVQEEMIFAQQRANTNINFVKFLTTTHKNLDKVVDHKKEWAAFSQRFPEMTANY